MRGEPLMSRRRRHHPGAGGSPGREPRRL